MNKRCFNTVESHEYLGVKRRFFELKIAPMLTGIRAGVSVVYEKADLDAAWEKYKLGNGDDRRELRGEKQLCEDQKAERRAYTARNRDMKLISDTKVLGFDSAASAILTRHRAG